MYPILVVSITGTTHTKARRKAIKQLFRAVSLLLLISTFTFVPSLKGQNTLADSSELQYKKPEPAVVKKLAEDERLHYKEIRVVRDNWLEQLLRELAKKLFNSDNEEGIERIVKILKWCIIIAAVLLIVYFLFRDEINKAIFFRSRKLASQVNRVATDEFQSHNLEDMISQLMSEGNYAAALRLMYIRALQLLHEKGFIHWTREKTNSELLAELRSHGDSGAFKSLGSLFEYVHYGNFAANEKVGLKASEDLKRIKQLTQE